MTGWKPLLRATAAAMFLFAGALPAMPPAGGGTSADATPMSPREKALHALNRLAFGPKPGDVDRVLAMGVSAWMESQLATERISDEATTRRLDAFPTLAMSQTQIFDAYERPLREERRRRKEAAGRAEVSADAAGAAGAAAAIPPENRPRRVIEELSAARIIRAVGSERQLNEVLVDFWMNQFNVYAAKGLDRVLVTSFEQETIRPRIWGRFEDLLLATAKSPAMLFYLDNARSVAEPANRPLPSRAARFGRFARRDSPEPSAFSAPPAGRGGLNENYARELMELQTLGVDGGYTQKDVTELARLLTGWSIDARDGARFVFRERVHDAEAKTILGRVFPAGGGIEEGERMIRILARDSSTARRIALALCRRLVSDDPPQALVASVAKRFLATDGDLRETVRAVIESPAFFDRSNYRSKVKTPFEYVVSAIRAAGGDTDGRGPVLRQIAQMGEPLYLCQPPTGYSDASTAWVNTGSLVARLNFALALSGDRVPGTSLDLTRLVGAKDAADPRRALDSLARGLVGGDLSRETRETIEKRLEERTASQDPSPNASLSLIAGLILGSPEFQRQ